MTLNVVVLTTGPLFSLAEAKAHLNVVGEDDDAIIGVYSDAAVARVLQYCNLPTVPDGDIPEALFKVAALIVLRDLFDGRGVAALSKSATDLVDPYRWLRV